MLKETAGSLAELILTRSSKCELQDLLVNTKFLSYGTLYRKDFPLKKVIYAKIFTIYKTVVTTR